MKSSATVMSSLLLVLLAVLTPPANAQTVSACGATYLSGGCRWFATYDTGDTFILPDTLGVDVPGEYHLSGTIEFGPTPCESSPDLFLTDIVVAPCAIDSLGCGRIVTWESDDGSCYSWNSLDGQRAYVLNDLQGFEVGDTVRAVGIPCPRCAITPGTCYDWAGILYHAGLSACRDSVNATVATTWGQIKNRYRR